ncbi:MAG: N-acetylmuramoyl-L-alanine amidase, partial [Clostridia bacterium]|nr:N-acetylmuramoyl-L-alanine amidase [Clostridia bacterium]
VIYTRESDSINYPDECVSIRQKKVWDIHRRMETMQAAPDAIFLSIHQNYFTQSKYSGAQVFYSANNAESKIIADSIQGSIKADIQNDNQRKTKKSGKEIYLLYHAESPAVMVECGFMSNPDEARLLCDEEYQIKMSVSIIDGLNDYLKAKGEL